MLQKFWPGLLVDRFVQEFVTPLVKVAHDSAARSSTARYFFSLQDFEQWRLSQPLASRQQWTSK